MTSTHPKQFTRNRILDALPLKKRAQLGLVEAFVAAGQVLCEPDQRLLWAYFPTSCVVSCLYTTRDGLTVETALIGNDGMLSVGSFLCGKCSTRAVVQIMGRALRVSCAALQAEFAHGGAVQEVLLQYTDVLLSQVAQTAICNRLHTLEQRVCRWLLMCHDRVERERFCTTQELIAERVGARRESVTVIAGRLQDIGAITYSRGHISITNRSILEELACECYQVVKKRNERGYRSGSYASFILPAG